MPILTLKFNENVIKTYRLDTGSALNIGRLESNDIFIENLAVSGNHAKIDSVGDGFLLTDLRSKNGTFVNEQPVNSHYLSHGDVVMIGKHTLIFEYEEGESRPEDASPAMEQTMVMDTDKHRELVAKTMANFKAPKSAASGVLSFLAGGEGEIELTKKLTKIGKDASCDVVVGGLMMGKTAATISLRPKGYFLSYVGGMAKPKVNDEVVKESVKLNEFDVIEIGSIKMQFIHKG